MELNKNKMSDNIMYVLEHAILLLPDSGIVCIIGSVGTLAPLAEFDIPTEKWYWKFSSKFSNL